MQLRKKYGLYALLVFCLATIGNTVSADTDLKFSNWIKEFKISGDYRLRYDQIHYMKPEGTPTNRSANRDRFRQRLRLGMDFTLPNNFAIKTRLATGSGEQTSTNQTMSNNGSEKAVWLDRMYLEWGALPVLTVQGGKMANPLWTPYSSDAIWDTDYNPEGAGQRYAQLFGNINLFANALQMVVQEDGNSPKDVYLFTEQIGIETRLPLESRLKVGFAYHDWHNVTVSSFTGIANGSGVDVAPKVQEGNTLNGNRTANEFGVSEITAELSSWFAHQPISVQGTFLKNNRVRESQTPKKDSGYQVGTIFGKAKEAQSWEIAYFYKWLEADATIADVADSDFGDGGTNRYGHIMWLAYNPREWLTLQTKYFMTKAIEPSLSTNDDIHRLQVDCVFKF